MFVPFQTVIYGDTWVINLEYSFDTLIQYFDIWYRCRISQVGRRSNYHEFAFRFVNTQFVGLQPTTESVTIIGVPWDIFITNH